MTIVSPPTQTPLELLAKRSYKTYEARILAAKRLNRRGRSLNFSLIALTVSATIASVAMLADPTLYGLAGGTLMVALAIVTFALSLVIPTLEYGARARDMTTSYRRIQEVATEAESMALAATPPSPIDVEALSERYQRLLDESENHTSGDYFRSAAGGSKLKYRAVEWLINGAIYATFLIPITLLLPLGVWFVNGL